MSRKRPGNKLTIDDFFNTTECSSDWWHRTDITYKDSMRNYAESLAGWRSDVVRLIEAGFILWNEEEAPGWGGPWCDVGVFYKVEDLSKTGWIKTWKFIYTPIKPIRLYLCGNDDVSYTVVFSSEKEALACLAEIVKSPTFDTLEKLGFEFTN